MIRIGDRFPETTLTESTEFGEACPLAPRPVKTGEQLAGKRVVVFGLPGAFTTTCSSRHLPGYLERHAALMACGIDEVWCVSVNDAYVMAAWGRVTGAIGKIRMLGDGAAQLATGLGLQTEIPGMGVRMRRFSMLVDDGIVKRINVEEPGSFGASSAETMLQQLESSAA